MMRKIYITILIVLFTLSGCKKNDGPRLSGTDSIDNRLYGTGPYYALGFSFPASKKISTLNSPLDLITINADLAIDGSVRKMYLGTENFESSFYRYGEYPDAASSSQAFKNLTSFSSPAWEELGDSVKSNQIWLFRTSLDTYAKFRITGTISEIRNSIPYVECTFEWVYQPDGSLTFP
jgi:hypothetical protein